jgi:hypothetical protein
MDVQTIGRDTNTYGLRTGFKRLGSARSSENRTDLREEGVTSIVY